MRARAALARATWTLEAAWSLAIARLAIRLLPFRLLARRLERQPRHGTSRSAPRGEVVAAVQRAIWHAVRWLPGDTVCFPRAVAAQAMLRRRGIATVLYYGARGGPMLEAHVWLQDGERGIMGRQAAAGYHILARYPGGE